MSGNPQIDLARDFLEFTDQNIFLTGRAGTGKTTFLRELCARSPKRMIVVAPTGVAAINAGGVTMHSFFQLPFGVYVPGTTRQTEEVRRFSKIKIAIIKSIDLLVIDEISMVRADTLDNVDEVLRRFRDRTKPFGGVQLLMIGDVQQLAPVVKDVEWVLLRDYYPSPFFFDSQALRATTYTSIELRHIYRQSDEGFIGLLSQVRDNRVDDVLLSKLNERCNPDFNPRQQEGYITLTSHNNSARAINDRMLEQLATREYSFEADIEGEFPDYLYPIEGTLRLKEGAQVMFTKNDLSPEHRYVNGTIGTVTVLRSDYIEVQPPQGNSIAVERADWANSRYSIDPDSKQIIEQVDGIFTQYPLKTAWAITIHKSQGLTFERAIIDAADSFSHGQVYVALSRCRTLEGMVLRSPLTRRSIISDVTVNDFSRNVEQNQPTENHLDAFKKQYYETLLTELFDFRALGAHYRSVGRFIEENMWRLYPKLSERWKQVGQSMGPDIIEVSLRFRMQISRLMSDDYNCNQVLGERVQKGATYFLEKTNELLAPLDDATKATLDNKDLKKRFIELLMRLGQELRMKLSTLASAQTAFTVHGYLEAKAATIVDSQTSAKAKLKTPKTEKTTNTEKILKGGKMPRTQTNMSAESDGPQDILNPGLFELLREWRSGHAATQSVPAYVVATQRALIGITNTLPSTGPELLAIKGIGKAFIERYGKEVLAIVEDYRTGKLG